MRRRAAAISSASLDERLPVAETHDEVSRLGETINAMLARLESGLARERQFVADASHELRPPLALLTTELELALRHARSAEELRGALQSAAESTGRLSRLTDDLLLLAGANDGEVALKPEQTDVADVVDQVAERFGVRAEADPIVVSADPLRLDQALSNIVDNAVRHGVADVVLTARQENGTVEIHVLDGGPGFPAEFLGRAFERFSRADATKPDGSGLGSRSSRRSPVHTVARPMPPTAREGAPMSGWRCPPGLCDNSEEGSTAGGSPTATREAP